MEKENSNKISLKLMSNKDNYMESFRKNVDLYLKEPGLTIRKLAEEAGIPFATLNNFLYNSTADVKLSTAISLARALGISIDELVGCETLTPEVRDFISTLRGLPDNELYLVKWFIQHQILVNSQPVSPKDKLLNVLLPVCNALGNLLPTNSYTVLPINEFSDDVKCKVFLGIRVTCETYMPAYSPYDTLLIANDRKAAHGEHSVVLYFGRLYIVSHHEVIENSHEITKYSSICDGHFSASEEELDEVIGYVAAVSHRLA